MKTRALILMALTISAIALAGEGGTGTRGGNMRSILVWNPAIECFVVKTSALKYVTENVAEFHTELGLLAEQDSSLEGRAMDRLAQLPQICFKTIVEEGSPTMQVRGNRLEISKNYFYLDEIEQAQAWVRFLTLPYTEQP